MTRVGDSSLRFPRVGFKPALGWADKRLTRLK